MYFRHISAKILPKNLKFNYHLFLAVQGNIWIGRGEGWTHMWLRSCAIPSGKLFIKFTINWMVIDLVAQFS